jgi:Ni/Co efflux regulator RcnB
VGILFASNRDPEDPMKRIGTAAVATAAVAASLAAGAGAGAQTTDKPPLREFEGRVVSIDRDARTFRLHDSERGTKRIRVNRNTRYERIGGFKALKVGDRNIEVTTRRKVDRAWLAIEVERSGGGGEHGGDDD